MTAESIPVARRTPVARLRWAVADGLVLVGREFSRLRQEPGSLIAALIFPAVMVLLFGYVFGSAILVPGGGDYRAYLMPGLFAMVTVSSVVAVIQRVAGDVSRGLMGRFRSMPMSRIAVPFGHTASDLVGGLLSIVIMAVAGLLVGWRASDGLLNALAGFGLLVLMRYALSWVGCYFGLRVPNEQVAQQLTLLVMPVTVLSNAFVPTDGLPGWLRFIAEWNPLSALIAACRELFGNPGTVTGSHAWPMDHPVAATVLWSVGLLVVFVPLSVRSFQRKGR
ncbi:ABC transporter permease [Streptomyces sp. RPA4-5]|uniref:ABC transporter permease n=1 Tax=Streptomyces sp. RPA4-5 TaxID=2721245 RepID=UPI00143E8118|nr:ABC transporter permease [Streptomyces sp. RPA4-5]QIY59056.1 ABC transporter permease [Streptomyces sp. RPA4-5]